jgi:hypothetical protein
MAIAKAPTDQVGVDVDLDLYDLTDLFYNFYTYHNHDFKLGYESYTYSDTYGGVTNVPRALSRFDSFRRIEAARLGSKPFFGDQGISLHKANKSLGYMQWFLTYLELPYKASLANAEYAKIRIDKRLHDLDKLSPRELEQLDLQRANNPIFFSNAEVSDDVTDAFNSVLAFSRHMKKCHERLVTNIPKFGLGVMLHNDIDFRAEPIDPVDLVTEPQAEWCPSTWNSFFIIRKMRASEVVKHIREETQFWNPEALRWALDNSTEGRGILSGRHYNYGYLHDSPETHKAHGENFMVKSYYADKAMRHDNINGYYGNMLVVEGYYINKKGGVDKVIFFPSRDYEGVDIGERHARQTMSDDEKAERGFAGADTLFYRRDVFGSLEEAVTVIPFNRSEPTLERQRGFGHELFSPLELVMRIDSDVATIATTMSTMFVKDLNQGQDGQDLQDLEIRVGGDMVDLGSREVVPNPFPADLQTLVNIRQVLLQHAVAKAFLGGLDGTETSGNGRGAQLANLRLVRDARVHKHNVEDFAAGLTEFYSKVLASILEAVEDKDLIDDKLLETRFFKELTVVQGHPEDILQYEPDDILEDTGLPYWMEVQAIRNGASHFGAAEIVVHREIMETFGSALDQQAMQALSRKGIESLIGSQDSIDILGDPRTRLVTNSDQVYQATLESASITGSVDRGALNFKPIIIRPQKDDHVTHLTQVHLPDAEAIIERIQQAQVASESLDDLSEQQLDTRNNMILKLSAHANHISLHAEQLERFGAQRQDINQLKERANVVMQTSEGLANNLERNLRALEAKRAETERRLRNISPENEVEKQKIQLELEKLNAQREKDRNQLMLANKIAEQRQQQHRDQQVSKARDRAQRERESQRKSQVDLQKTVIQSQTDMTNTN